MPTTRHLLPAALLLCLAAPLLARAQVPAPARDLVAAYPFDGSVRDVVGGRPARAVGVRPAPGHDGRPGGALWFDGRDLADLGGGFDTPLFSVAAWVRPEAPGGVPMIVLSRLRDVRAHAYRNFELRINPDGRPYLLVAGGQRWDGIAGDQPLPPGRWTHLAATYDGTRAQLWVNGSPAAPPLLVRYAQSPTPLFVGARGEGRRGGPELFFRGAIEDVRVWSRPLDEGEVLRAAGRAPPPPPPPPRRDPDDDEGREEAAFLIRVDRLIERWDLACAGGDGAALDQVEARIVSELDRGEAEARSEGNERIAGALRRAAAEVDAARGKRHPQALDRKRTALARLAEALWADLVGELPPQGLDADQPRRRSGRWY